MKMHANARLSLEGRELLIERVEHAPRGGLRSDSFQDATTLVTEQHYCDGEQER